MARADGYMLVVRPEGPPIEADTLMCVHCNKHWAIKPGSGNTRGFCTLCNGPHCGSARCWQCIPLERKVEEGLMRQRFAQAAGLVTE